METINNIFRLTADEIDRKIDSLHKHQREALSCLTGGMDDTSAADLLGVKLSTFRMRLRTAAACVGVASRAQLIALYSVWRYNHYSVWLG